MVNHSIQKITLQSWWLIAYIIIGLIFYEKSMQKREYQLFQLQQQFIFLEEEKQKVIQIQKNLQLQANSQSDPAWIELVLMKNLGVAPEDQEKFYFFQKNNQVEVN